MKIKSLITALLVVVFMTTISAGEQVERTTGTFEVIGTGLELDLVAEYDACVFQPYEGINVYYGTFNPYTGDTNYGYDQATFDLTGTGIFRGDPYTADLNSYGYVIMEGEELRVAKLIVEGKIFADVISINEPTGYDVTGSMYYSNYPGSPWNDAWVNNLVFTPFGLDVYNPAE